MAKNKSALVLTTTKEQIERIIQLKTRNKRMTIKTIAERLNIDKKQVKLVLQSEKNHSNQSQSPPPSSARLPLFQSFSLEPTDEHLSCDHDNDVFPEMGSNDDTSLSLTQKKDSSSGDHNYSLQDVDENIEWDKSEHPEPVFNVPTDEENISDNDYDEEEQSVTNGVNYDFEKNEQEEQEPFQFDSTEHQPISAEMNSYIQTSLQYLAYVHDLENSNRRLSHAIVTRDETNKQLNEELAAERQKATQLNDELIEANQRSKEALARAVNERQETEKELAEALKEKHQMKKSYAVLQASQNDSKNQCDACQKKLVFTVGKMVVCRSCSDEIKSQFSVYGKPAN